MESLTVQDRCSVGLVLEKNTDRDGLNQAEEPTSSRLVDCLTCCMMSREAPRKGQSSQALTMEGDYEVKQKTSLGVIVLGIFAALLTVSTVVLGVLYGLEASKNESPSPPQTTDVCQTQECITAASRILNAMNPSANPCEDFFEYSCGTWIENHIIPEDKSSASTFSDLRDDVSATLKRVLERSAAGDRESITKAKNFYGACYDTETIDNLGVGPVTNLIQEMGGWPVMDGTFTENLSLEETLATFLSKYGTNGILASWVGTDDKDSKARIIHLDQPSLGMPNRDYYLDSELRNKTEPGYRQFMTDFMTMVAGQQANSTRIDGVVNQIIELETAIAGSMAPQSERRDTTAIYNKMTVSELQQKIPGFQWLNYLTKMIEVVDDQNILLTQDENVVVYGMKYINDFLSVVNQSSELVQNYLVWRVMQNRITYMSKALRNTRQPYTEATSGTTQESPRWDTCSGITNDFFPMPVGALFVEEAFSEDYKQATEEMIEDLRAVFKGMIPANDWMDDATKQAADEKADQITPVVAYPDYILDPNDPKMDEDLKGIIVNPKELFSNVNDITMLNIKQSLGKLRKEVDFSEWTIGPAIVNAFYSPSRNQITFPAGILQPPFYDGGQPASMNYGAIGMVIGHEITHGFDDSGSQFDGQGNLQNWWSNSSRDNFNVRAQCMIDQYSAIEWDTAGGDKINGELTLGENIADNGGLRQAFEAYARWKNAHPEGDLLLPGLSDFTQEQLFFIGNAQVWCGSYTPEYAKRLLTTDPHSPGVFRVLVPDQNYAEFGKAFNCQQGKDPMFPTEDKTCRVW